MGEVRQVLVYPDDADRQINGKKPVAAAARFRREMLRRCAPPHEFFIVPLRREEVSADVCGLFLQRDGFLCPVPPGLRQPRVCVCTCARVSANDCKRLHTIAHGTSTLVARQRQQEPTKTKQGMALQLGAHKLHAADDAGPNWGRFFSAAMGGAGKKKPAEKAKESARDGRPEEWEEKAMDAQELKGLVAQATRERVRAYLRGHAEHLLECAREEKRQAAALNGDDTWPLQSPQKVSRAGSPARGSRKAGAGRGKTGQPTKGERQGHQAMLVLTRGEEGFVCLNLAKEWFDVPELKLPKTLLHGTYQESVYGFLIEVDAKHTITAWGGDGSGHVKIGPESALVFTRTARAENDNHETVLA